MIMFVSFLRYIKINLNFLAICLDFFFRSYVNFSHKML